MRPITGTRCNNVMQFSNVLARITAFVAQASLGNSVVLIGRYSNGTCCLNTISLIFFIGYELHEHTLFQC